jgi:AhpD family alkylhydroperoxidase
LEDPVKSDDYCLQIRYADHIYHTLCTLYWHTKQRGYSSCIFWKIFLDEWLAMNDMKKKGKALIALACSTADRCDSCVQRHREMARKAGACREGMLEAAAIVSLVRMDSG